MIPESAPGFAGVPGRGTAMDLETFLRRHGADFDLLVEGAQAAGPLREGDRLLAVGSLAEGLGNSKSDVDLLLVSPREEFARASPDEILSFAAGNCVVDLRILSQSLVASLQARLAAFAQAAWDLTRPADFTAGELLLLHRLSAARCLWPGAEAQDPVTEALRDAVARLKLHGARHLAKTLQVDMAGYRDAGDYRTLVFGAQDLLGHAVDGLLAGFHLTNPTPKWRGRLLAQLPGDWDSRLLMRPTGIGADDLVWHLHRAPAEATAKAALEHACRIVTFARAAFAWAEDTLVHGNPVATLRSGWPKPRGQPLPCLDIDVDFCRTEEGVAVGRLNAFGETLHLSSSDFAVMLLFDGVTTAHEAAMVVETLDDDGARGDVERVASWLRRFFLEAAV